MPTVVIVRLEYAKGCNVLKLPIEKVALRTGKFIKGLRLRISGVDDYIPSYEMQLEEVVSNQSSMPPPPICDGSGDGLVTDSVAAEMVAIQGCDECDGLNQLLNEDEINPEKLKNDFSDTDPKIDDLAIILFVKTLIKPPPNKISHHEQPTLIQLNQRMSYANPLQSASGFSTLVVFPP